MYLLGFVKLIIIYDIHQYFLVSLSVGKLQVNFILHEWIFSIKELLNYICYIYINSYRFTSSCSSAQYSFQNRALYR